MGEAPVPLVCVLIWDSYPECEFPGGGEWREETAALAVESCGACNTTNQCAHIVIAFGVQ